MQWNYMYYTLANRVLRNAKGQRIVQKQGNLANRAYARTATAVSPVCKAGEICNLSG